MKKKFLFSALAAVLCFAACNKDDDYTEMSVYDYYQSIELGESNDPSLKGPIIDPRFFKNLHSDTHSFNIEFWPATSQKEGGDFFYQIFVSPDNGKNWEEIRKVSEKKLKERNYTDDPECLLHSFGGYDDTLNKDFIPDLNYLVKIRANYVLNNDTTFAESQTESFPSIFVKNKTIYIEKYTSNSITIAIDNSFFNDYKEILFYYYKVGESMDFDNVITIPYGQTSFTIDNLENTKYIIKYFYMGYYHFDDENKTVNGIREYIIGSPHEEKDDILEYAGNLTSIKNANTFQYSVLESDPIYYFNDYIPDEKGNQRLKKGWHKATNEELEYIKNNKPEDYKKYKGGYPIVVKD